MAFTYDIATTLGQLRLYVKDTVSATALWTDAELNAILANNGSDVYSAAADVLTILAGDAARLATYISVLGGDTVVDRKQIANQLLAVAKTFAEKAGQLDTTDEFVDWHLHLAVHDGRDETTYTDADENEETYHDVHFFNRGGEA